MNFTNLFSGFNFKEMLKHLPDAVLLLDSNGRIVWANREAEFLFEIDTTEEADYYFDDFVNKGFELASQSASKHVPVIAGASVGENNEFFIELNSSQYEDQFLVTIRDVTAMTKVLANAEKTGKLNKDKNLMLTRLANDFKSPLQSIIGFSNALSDGLGGEISEKQDKYVKIIGKNASELLYFMDKFFEFSKAESNLVKFDLKTFDAVNAVQEVIRSFDSIIFGKKVSINLEYDELASKTVTTDDSVLKTAIKNILDVSLKMTEIGAITVSLFNPDMENVIKRGVKVINQEDNRAYLQISIKDTGTGFKETDLEGLFEPYSQLEKINKKNFIRSIVLSTVRTLVDRLHGTIWVETEIMKGTTFNIILPVEKGIILEDE